MKVRTRSVPLDILSIEEKGRAIVITTHRQKIHFLVSANNSIEGGIELSFEQLRDLILKHDQ